jgi:hypothetical protein
MDQKAKYCELCGQATVPTEMVPKYNPRYHPRTGRPFTKMVATCINWDCNNHARYRAFDQHGLTAFTTWVATEYAPDPAQIPYLGR